MQKIPFPVFTDQHINSMIVNVAAEYRCLEAEYSGQCKDILSPKSMIFSLSAHIAANKIA